jgi:hypothetical protein
VNADAAAWVMANKVKSVAGLIASLAAVIVIPISVAAWAEDLAEEKARDAELRMEGKVEALQSTTQAAHNYDFYEVRQQMVEEDLIELEEAELAGEELTPTEERKKVKLTKNLETFEAAKLEALEQLKGDAHETE